MSKILDGFKIGFGIFLFFGLLFGIVFAIGFHNAGEILGGTFSGDYIFENNVEFSDGIVLKNSSICDLSNEGKLQYDSTSKLISLCNGTAWTNLTGNLNLEGLNGNDVFTKLLLHFDGSWQDSASSYPVTTAGDASVSVPGKFTNAVTLDGVGDYVNIADSGDWTFDGDFTIDFWVKTTSSTASCYDAMFATGEYNAVNSIVIFQRTEDSAVTIYMNGVTRVIQGTTSINDGVWHHVALVRNLGNVMMFIDGVQEGITYSFPGTLDSEFVRIGYTKGACDTYFTGDIDEVRVSKNIARWTTDFTVPTGPYS